MIDSSTVERIFSTAQIVDVVGDYVALKKRGVNYSGLCPFHNEKTPSFSVSPGKNIYKCFGCGKAGNPVNFVMELEQMSYGDALKYLAKKYHIEIVEDTPTDEEIQKRGERESLLIVTEWARNYFVDTLKNHKDGIAIARTYLRERGIRDDIAEKFQLGYCIDERETLSKTAVNAGFKPYFLDKIGVSKLREDGSLVDKVRGRIIFPIHAVAGKIIGFGARVLKTDNKEIAKYLNSPESEIYHKSHTLYGIFFGKNAIVKHDKCFLVEGYMDVIAMFQAGIENVVASSGTSLTLDQIRLIRRFTKNVTIIYDGDSAGIKAAFRGIPMVLEEGLNVRILLLPDGHDPDSFAKAYSATALQEYISKNEHDFITFTADYLLKESSNDPVKRATVISDIIKTIAVIPDQIYRQVYIKDLSQLFKVDESVIYNQINLIRKEKSTSQKPVEPLPFEIKQEPSQQTAPTQNLDYKFSTVERDLLRLLILHGELPLHEYPQEEGARAILNVRDLFLKEIVDGGMEFINETYKAIFDDYVAQFEGGNIITEQYYFTHQNQEFQRFALDTLHFHYKLSRLYYIDKTQNLDEIDSKQEAEKLALDKLVIDSLLSYKLQRVKMETAKLNDSLKNVTELDQINEIVQSISQFKAIEKHLALELNRL
jgi:DNA primase